MGADPYTLILLVGDDTRPRTYPAESGPDGFRTYKRAHGDTCDRRPLAYAGPADRSALVGIVGLPVFDGTIGRNIRSKRAVCRGCRCSRTRTGRICNPGIACSLMLRSSHRDHQQPVQRLRSRLSRRRHLEHRRRLDLGGRIHGTDGRAGDHCRRRNDDAAAAEGHYATTSHDRLRHRTGQRSTTVWRPLRGKSESGAKVTSGP